MCQSCSVFLSTETIIFTMKLCNESHDYMIFNNKVVVKNLCCVSVILIIIVNSDHSHLEHEAEMLLFFFFHFYTYKCLALKKPIVGS